MSNLEEENKRLRAENELSKKVIETAFKYFEKWDAMGFKPEEQPKEEKRDTRYDALLQELQENDNLLNNRHQSHTPPKQQERAESKYKALLDELEVGEYKLNK